MADLSWARELGAERRAALDRDAKHDPNVALRLVNAMFDGLITQLWRRLGVGVKETVEAYNIGGRFSDVFVSTTGDHILVERRHPPAFTLDLQLHQSSRLVQLTITDGADVVQERLPVVFVDDELLLWHGDQTENGYQLAKRLLKPRL